MNQKRYLILLLLIPLTAILFMSYSSGQTYPYSGSPGDNGNSCAVCHSGGDFNASVEIITNIPEEGYTPGQTYTIQVIPNSSASKHGFQITAENIDNDKVGSFSSGTGNQTANNNHLVTHTTAGTLMTEWSMTWTAPEDNTGANAAITFYVALNAANGDGSTGGDQVITDNLSIESITGVDSFEKEILHIHPNPVDTSIKLGEHYDDYEYEIIDTQGKVLQAGRVHNDLPVSLESGLYYLILKKDTKVLRSPFIKR